MKIRNARQASYGSTLIETFFKSQDGQMLKIGMGTGFFTKIESTLFLVTNWHVLTNRDPNNAQEALSRAGSPTHIQLHLPRIGNPNHFVPMDYVPLYDIDQSPTWLEGSLGFSGADIAMLPCSLPGDALCPLIEDFAPYRGAVLEPGIDVCIIGFPFDRNVTNPFPIWKKAMVASEPNYLINGKPFAYLDTPGRPGMSGSPVYAISDAILVSQKLHEDIESISSRQVSALDLISKLSPEELANPSNRTRKLEFIGIYSGSAGDDSLNKLNLGRFWPYGVLENIKSKPICGSNPVPPNFF